MGEFCASNPLTGMSQTEITNLFGRIRTFLGEPVMGVELADIQLEYAIQIAIEEYSTDINNWVLKNRLGEMLGLPSDVDFTMKYVSNSLYFEQSFSKSVGESLGIGVAGTRPILRDTIVLTAGTQDYVIPAGRELQEILWYSPSFLNLFGLDPFGSNNIDIIEFQASFVGQSLYSVLPVWDILLSANALSMRNRVFGSEYSYVIRPWKNGQKILKLYPIPMPNSPQAGAGYQTDGVTGGIGTPGTIFYHYMDRFSTVYGNPDYSGTTANPTFTGFTQAQIDNGTNIGNNLVSSPADAKLNFLSYSSLNSTGQRWVKRYALALAKEILGIGVRGKFNSQLPIPGMEMTLNSADLIQTGREDQQKLKDELKEQLDELSYDKILERRAVMQKSVYDNLSITTPLGITRF